MKKNCQEIDSALLKGCKKGKRKYQEMLYKQFYAYVMSICLRYSYSREEAGEILNDSFMKIFENIKNYNADYSFKSWIRRIIINTAIDYLRKERKHKLCIEIDDTNQDFCDENVIDDLNVEEILKLLNELPDMYRTTFNLFEMEGYSHKEIAEILDISESTSRSNLTRAKKMLRIAFKKKFSVKEIEFAV